MRDMLRSETLLDLMESRRGILISPPDKGRRFNFAICAVGILVGATLVSAAAGYFVSPPDASRIVLNPAPLALMR
ncbi:hypothetical protein LMIY3S_02361 [Labrys miyagiensis]